METSTTYQPLTDDELAAWLRAQKTAQDETCPECHSAIEWEGTAFPEDFDGDVYGDCTNDECAATVVSGRFGIEAL